MTLRWAPDVAALVSAIALLAFALPGWLWVRRGGHRRPGDTGERRGAHWLPLACLALGGGLGFSHWATRGFLVVLVVAAALLLVLTAVDLDVHRLPDVLTGPLFLVVLGGLLVVGLGAGDLTAWRRSLVAGAVTAVLYLVLVLLGGGSGMGMGDLKLAPSLGMLLGHVSYGAAIGGTLLSFLVGGLAATWLLLARGADRNTQLAFGPAMVVGTMAVLCLPTLGSLP